MPTFSNELKENSVRGWEEYYIAYKRLKRVIQKIVLQLQEERNKEKNNNTNNADNNNNNSNNNDSNAKDPLTKAKETQLAMPADSSESSSDEETASHTQDKKSGTRESTFLLPDRTDTEAKAKIERRSVMNARINSDIVIPKETKDTTKDNKDSNLTVTNANHDSSKLTSVSATPPPGSPLLTSQKQKQRLEWASVLLSGDAKQQFFHLFDSELEKINTFYQEKITEINTKYNELSSGYEIGIHNNNSQDDNKINAKSSSRARVNMARASSLTDGNLNTAINNSNNLNYGSVVDVNESKYTDNNNITSPSLTERNNNVDNRPINTITATQAQQLENRCKLTLKLYRIILQLQSYVKLNRKGFDKIMKKHDKYALDNKRKATMGKVDKSPFMADRNNFNILSRNIEELYLKLSFAAHQDVRITRQLLRAVERDVENNLAEDSIDSIYQKIKNDKNNDNNLLSKILEQTHNIGNLQWDLSATSYIWLIIAIISFIMMYNLPILTDHPRAHRCAALLAFVTVLFTTEAIPYFVTALLIPLFVVLLKILADDNGVTLPAEKASKAAFGAMYNDATILILSGFTIAIAFSKSSYELKIANIIHYYTGNRPKLFLLAYMFLGCFLSLFISNIAAPVLITSLLLPHLRDFQRNNGYARALLLGLAFSCNIGGLVAPISSPENLIILGYMEAKFPAHQISFLQWCLISIPFSIVCIIMIWIYLYLAILQFNVEDIPIVIPSIIYDKPDKLTKSDIMVLFTTIVSVILMLLLEHPNVRHIFGSMSTIGLIPILLFFGSGILTKNDLKYFSWQLILLIGGGSVLGLAINSSKLINLITDALLPYFQSQSIYINALSVIVLIFFSTSIVSHTVAAIILTPIIISIGTSIHHSHVITIVAAFMINCTCTLPMTSFPNMNSLLVDDDFGRPFLHAWDFIRHGTAVSMLLLVLLSTYGYTLIRLAFDKPVFTNNP